MIYTAQYSTFNKEFAQKVFQYLKENNIKFRIRNGGGEKLIHFFIDFDENGKNV